jgi:hypothetical protein
VKCVAAGDDAASLHLRFHQSACLHPAMNMLRAPCAPAAALWCPTDGPSRQRHTRRLRLRLVAAAADDVAVSTGSYGIGPAPDGFRKNKVLVVGGGWAGGC